MVDTCAAEFAAETPYFYATYAAAGSPPEAPPVPRPAALVIGSGPVRIGQGIEFDYCAVQAAQTLRADGQAAVMVNSNPETVSTDFDASSRLYFEPLDAESVLEVIDAEIPGRGRPSAGAACSSAGRRRSTWRLPCRPPGVPLPGLDLEAIERTEERTRFAEMVDRLGIPQPRGGMATSLSEALAVAEEVGYPVLVRPSFVIGGLAIDFCHGPSDLERQLATATIVSPERPVRIDAYLEGLEVDVDAVTDGRDVLIPGLMAHVERAGVHSGDSVAVFPPQQLSAARPGPHRLGHAPDLPGDRRARPRQRPVHRARRRGLRAGGQPAGQPDACPSSPRSRACRWWRWRHASARAPGWRTWAGATGSCRRRPSWPSRRRSSRRPSCAAWTPASVQACSPRARSSACTPTPTWPWPRRCWPRRCGRRCQGRAVRKRSSPWPPGTWAGSPSWPRPWPGSATGSSPRRARPASLRALGSRGARGGPAGVGGARGCHPSSTSSPGATVSLVVNTPAPRSGAVLDAAAIRHAAVAEGILCLTDIDTAVAAARSLDPATQARVTDVRSLAAWLGGEDER